MPHPILRCALALLFLRVILPFQAFGATDAQLDLAGLTEVLKAVETAQAKKIPKALTLSPKRGGRLDKGDYDPTVHLKAFPRLKLASGTALDFVYDLQDLGGHPIVYARHADEQPFPDLEAFRKSHPRKYFLGGEARFNPAYLESVTTDNSPDGFLQLGLLVLSAEQFYLHWHAVYFRYWPVADRATLEDIASTLPENLRGKARAIDFTPRVMMDEKEVAVEYLVYNAWEGLKRITWTVSRSAPHRFVKVTFQVVLPYKSPVRF